MVASGGPVEGLTHVCVDNRQSGYDDDDDDVLNRWNSLSQDLVDSTSVNSFKSGLEKLRR